MALKKPPRFYFSLRSPYSWFAFRDLTERYSDVADAVEWAPYYEPDQRPQAALDALGVQLPMSRAKHFYILQDVRRLAEARGWTVTWPVDQDPWWEPAHLAYLVAADAGRGREYVGRVSRARWELGQNISDPDTIGQIGADMGFDAALFANAADDEDLRQRGVEHLVASYRDGLFGVPFFAHGRNRYFGIDRLATFVAAVRGATAPGDGVPTPAPDGIPALSVPMADSGPAGGCG
jgi:2-hydroxychromene-2-carboxylate isomerase